MVIFDILYKAKRLFPKNLAVICEKNRYTYEQLYNRVLLLASFLKRMGVKKGERVAIIHRNCHLYLESYFATSVLGAILCSINIRLSPKEVAFIIDDSGSKIVIAEKDLEELIKKAEEMSTTKFQIVWTKEGDFLDEVVLDKDIHIESQNVFPDDPAHLYYTSGTTGRPKGVVLTHRNVVFHSLMTIAELHIDESDIWLHAAPMFHLADAWATFAITWVGGRHVMVKKFLPKAVIEMFSKEKITITNMVPTMYNMLLSEKDVEKYDYSSLRVLLSGGAPMPPELASRIINIFGCSYIQTYGLTETSPYLTMSKPKESMRNLSKEEEFRIRVKTGREILGVKVKVVDEKGKEVLWNDKEVGEIIAKGPTITPGYWNLPDETKSAFKDGWFYTGDLATIDSEGYITIVDRKKDMIITGGENVYSTEVENVLYMHPSVYEAAVVGVPDKMWGEIVKAYIVLREGASLDKEEIISFCKKHLSSYKVPKEVEFISELPKTGSGKIRKEVLRKMAKKEV